MGMAELKPCPFCGCGDRRVGIRKQSHKGYKVICGRCGGSGPYVTIKDYHDNKEIARTQAERKWNRRAADSNIHDNPELLNQ